MKFLKQLDKKLFDFLNNFGLIGSVCQKCCRAVNKTLNELDKPTKKPTPNIAKL